MPYNLTLAEIRQFFDRPTFSRGLNYQREGRVLVAEWDDEVKILFGEVEGSGERVYEQEIYFTPARNRRVMGSCTCPVGGSCKHVVAVLLEFIELNHELPEKSVPAKLSALERWQKDTLKLLADKQVAAPQPGSSFILYLLNPVKGKDGLPEIELTTVKSRLLKKGGWGKASSYRLFDLIAYDYYRSYDDGVRSVDKEIARLLSDGNRSYSYQPTSLRLQGDVGVLVLQRLLLSRRCYYKNLDNPPLVAVSRPLPRQPDWPRSCANISQKVWRGCSFSGNMRFTASLPMIWA